MILKDISFKTPVENILYDDVLLTLAEQDKGGEVLRLWESEIVFIVFPFFDYPVDYRVSPAAIKNNYFSFFYFSKINTLQNHYIAFIKAIFQFIAHKIILGHIIF